VSERTRGGTSGEWEVSKKMAPTFALIKKVRIGSDRESLQRRVKNYRALVKKRDETFDTEHFSSRWAAVTPRLEKGV